MAGRGTERNRDEKNTARTRTHRNPEGLDHDGALAGCGGAGAPVAVRWRSGSRSRAPPLHTSKGTGLMGGRREEGIRTPDTPGPLVSDHISCVLFRTWFSSRSKNPRIYRPTTLWPFLRGGVRGAPAIGGKGAAEQGRGFRREAGAVLRRCCGVLRVEETESRLVGC